jgi:HSP20 family molecular chaperone IbpA
MTKVAVTKVAEPHTAARPLFEEISELFETVRRRAFELFQARGFTDGRDVDDWLQAEQELLNSPPVELIENDTEFRVRIPVPGFDAKDLQVTALSDVIILQADVKTEDHSNDAKVLIREFNSKKLFRRIEMPSAVDLDRVTATVENGVLQLIAGKAAPVKEKKVSISAGRQAA